jgi:RHS repeat-associated protein
VDQSQGLHFNLRYPGQYYDEETGWRFNGFRYYDPDTGRFLEPDPIGLRGGLNQYAYPANPLRDLDRDGLSRDCRAAESEEARRQIEEGMETPHTPMSEMPEFSRMTLGEIRQSLHDAGYERLCGPGERTIVGRDGRPRTIETSEIWMSREPGPNGEYDAVRIDPGGHQSARDQGFEGGDSHAHRETVPPEFADRYRREFTPEAQTQDDQGNVVPRPADDAPESEKRAWAQRTHVYPRGS